MRRPPHHRVGGALQGLRAAAGAILDHHAKAAGIADAGNRRRRCDENQAVMDRRKALKQLSLDRGGRLPRIGSPLLEWIKRDENRAGIRRVCKSGTGKAHDIDRVRDSRDRQRDLDRLPVDLIGAGKRRRRRELRNNDEIAAVELRNKADRRFAEFVQAKSDDPGINHQHQHRDTHKFCRELAVAARQHVEITVERREEPADRPAPPMAIFGLGVRLEQ